MKLKNTVSKSTSLEPEMVIFKIMWKLKDRRYLVINTTKNSVEFEDNSWKMTSRSEGAKRWSGGRFEIVVVDGVSMVIFNYYLSLTWPVFLIVAMSIFMIVNGEYYGPLFPLTFFSIAILIHFTMLKGYADEMLDEVTA